MCFTIVAVIETIGPICSRTNSKPEDSSFDAVIDKSVIDALACGDNANLVA